MFSFFKAKKIIDVGPYLRRLCDLTTPNLASSTDSARAETRYNRTIPTLVCPWSDGYPETEKSVIGLSKDISDRGVGLVLSAPFYAEEVVLGFWLNRDTMEVPWFFLGYATRLSAMGGGFWTLGVEVREFANTEFSERMMPLTNLAAKLLPPAS